MIVARRDYAVKHLPQQQATAARPTSSRRIRHSRCTHIRGGAQPPPKPKKNNIIQASEQSKSLASRVWRRSTPNQHNLRGRRRRRIMSSPPVCCNSGSRRSRRHHTEEKQQQHNHTHTTRRTLSFNTTTFWCSGAARRRNIKMISLHKNRSPVVGTPHTHTPSCVCCSSTRVVCAFRFDDIKYVCCCRVDRVCAMRAAAARRLLCMPGVVRLPDYRHTDCAEDAYAATHPHKLSAQTGEPCAPPRPETAEAKRARQQQQQQPNVHYSPQHTQCISTQDKNGKSILAGDTPCARHARPHGIHAKLTSSLLSSHYSHLFQM